LFVLFASAFAVCLCSAPSNGTGLAKATCDPAMPVSLIFEVPFSNVSDATQRLACVLSVWVKNSDQRAQFLIVYLEITRKIEVALGDGTFTDVQWMDSYTTSFANYFRNAVYNWEVGKVSDVPTSWVITFQHAHDKDLLIVQNAILGISAHILHDLPHAIADVDVNPNQDTKFADSEKVTGILLPVYQIIENSLLKFYAPVLNLASFDFIIDWASTTGLSLERTKAFWMAVLLDDGGAITRFSVSQLLDASSITAGELIAHLPSITGPLFYQLKALEGADPVQTMCNVVPLPCQ